MPIDRRRFLKGAGATAALGLTGALQSLAAWDPPDGARRPNVLVLFSDQHSGKVLGCAGDDQAQTPHLDALAADGMHFTHGVSNHPVCCPERATIMTGLYAHRHGIKKNNVRLDAKHRHFAQVFAAAGYATGYCGKWHLDGGIPQDGVGGIVPRERRGGWQDWHGYEKSHKYFTVYDYDDEKRFVVEGRDWEPAWHTDLVLDFARRQRDAGKPWVYFCSYGPPHLPKECPQAWLDRYPLADIKPNPAQQQRAGLKADTLRQELQMYYGQVSAVDHEVGRVRQGLKDLGIDDNTIVVYTADHGDLLGTHGKMRGKSEPYGSASRVPFLVSGPGIVQGRSGLPVSGVDVAPTLLSLAGLEIPQVMQGTDLAGCCRGGAAPELDASYLALGNWEATFDGRHLYSPAKRCCYDWLEDPHELKNLWDDEALRGRLEGKLRAVKERIGA